jgi:DNA-binding NtrC family response regulator
MANILIIDDDRDISDMLSDVVATMGIPLLLLSLLLMGSKQRQ